MSEAPFPIGGNVWSRFWKKVDTSGLCWQWRAFTHEGYGRFGITQDDVRGAHRLAWQMLVGEIPEGMQLDHLCRNRGCVNPDHLEIVTMHENKRRARLLGGRRMGYSRYRAEATHCQRGHEFTPENTGHQPRRFCRTCQRAAARRRRVAKKGLAC